MASSRPTGVPWLTPYLTVRDARVATAFFEAAFGFKVRDSVQDNGVVMHVEMTYQDSLDRDVRPRRRVRLNGTNTPKRRRNRTAVVLSVCR